MGSTRFAYTNLLEASGVSKNSHPSLINHLLNGTGHHCFG